MEPPYDSGFEIGALFSNKDENKPPLWTDVITTARQKHRISKGLIPREYVLISDDGGDYTFYLDNSNRRPDEECPVVALGPGVDEVVVSNDFFDFAVRAFEGNISF